jgi:MHS family proline/betaine transporter-like MFS transporter
LLGLLLSILFYFLPELDSLELFVGFQLLTAAGLGVFIGPVFILIQSLFPPQYKYSGFAVPSSLGQAVLIGSTPLIASTITSLYGMAYVSLFLACSFILTIVATFFAKPAKKQ